MSDGIHIHWGPQLQPATRYRMELPDGDGVRYIWRTAPGGRLGWCHRCRCRRRLSNLLIAEQAWYDPYWVCRVCPSKQEQKQRKARAKAARKQARRVAA